MEFLAGTMLWGILGAAVPLIIHLTGRAKPIPHRFPALRFILLSQRSSSRAMRLKHLLILLMRMGLFALLAIALARPLFPWGEPAAAHLPGRLSGDFVLVLDSSASMNYLEKDTARFDLARQQALEFLDRLAPDARIAVIKAGEQPENLQGRLTLEQERVRSLIKEARCGAGGMDLARALSSAQQIFAREMAPDRARAILVFTDMQKYEVQALRARGAGDAGDPTAKIPVLCVDVSSREARNGAVLSVRIPGPTVAAESTVTLDARLRPLDPNRSMLAELFVDERKVQQVPIDPKGAEELDVQFALPSGAAGAHTGSLRLAQSDGLLLDQERHFAYQAGRPPRVLVLEKQESLPGKGSGFFIRAALGTASASGATGLALTILPADELTTGKLAQYQVIVLADCGDLSDTSWAALARFVEEGGGLFVWAGPRTNAIALRRNAYSEFAQHLGLLPGRIDNAVQLAMDKGLSVKVARPEHPLLARFTPDVLSELRDVRVRRYVKVMPELKDKNAESVLDLLDGSPLLLEKSYGRGRVLFATIAPDVRTGGPPEFDGSDLPKRGVVFLTLVLDGCRLLAGRGEESSVRVGKPLALTIQDPPADGEVRWRAPNAAERSLRAEFPLEDANAPKGQKNEARSATLLVPALDTPGIHRFVWRPPLGKDDKMLEIVANLPEEESDLEPAAQADAAQAFAPHELTLVRDVDEAPFVAASRPHGSEWPVTLMLAVMTVLLFESFLANRLYRTLEEPVPPVAALPVPVAAESAPPESPPAPGVVTVTPVPSAEKLG